MSALPTAVQVRNRQLIAQRLGWPYGALAKCIALEEEFPRWMIWWTIGGLRVDPEPGYRASVRIYSRTVELYSSNIEGLRFQVAAVDQVIPQ